MPRNEQAKRLLTAGAAAGPVYILVGIAQILTRDGFDVRRHALSLLSNGRFGWIQIANFIVCGLLVIAGACGVRERLRGQRAGTWGPVLLSAYGLGLIGAGIFVADPASGFPPGSPAQAGLSPSGVLHFVSGAFGFYSLIAACFVFARRFAAMGRPGWTAWSVFAGVAFFVSFAAIASGSSSSAVMLAFYAAVALIWTWHATLSLALLRERTVASGVELAAMTTMQSKG